VPFNRLDLNFGFALLDELAFYLKIKQPKNLKFKSNNFSHIKNKILHPKIDNQVSNLQITSIAQVTLLLSQKQLPE
jgi:hypothetical protein